MLSIGTLRGWIIRNIASPYALAMFSYLIFMLGWLFPPQIYSTFIPEPDLLFLNPLVFLYYTACLVAFILGITSILHLTPSHNMRLARAVTSRSPMLFILMPLFATTVFCLLFLIHLGGKINWVAFLLSQQGDTIKDVGWGGGLDAGIFAWSLPFLTGTIWWATYRIGQLHIQPIKIRILRLMLAAAIAVGSLTCVATVDRSALMPIVAGTGIVSSHLRSLRGTSTVKRLAIIVGGGGSLCLLLFIFLSLARGDNSGALVVTHILGYFMASYNRLAAIVDGTMRFTYGSTHAYLFPALASSGAINSVLPLKSIFGWPTGFQLWSSEFTSVAAAGLIPTYIWAGAFGYLYSDIGWASLVYMFLVGILTGWLWKRFKRGETFGVVGYIWSAFCILFGSEIITFCMGSHSSW